MTKAAELAKMGEVLTNSQIGGRRNMVINGAMQVAQRGTSFTDVSTSAYQLDRFKTGMGDTTARFTVTQATAGLNGFANSFKYDCTTAEASLANASARLFFHTRFEGQDLQQLKKGTSDAEKVTVSFYVKSNKTGTYTLELQDQDNSRSNSQTYTISSSNTWERKIITFDADTTGAFDDDNALSLIIYWHLIAGTTYTSGTFNTSWATNTNANRVSSSNVNIGDSTDNTWEITGIQMEVGSQATPFEHRSFGEELALCQRYFLLYADSNELIGGGGYQSSTFPDVVVVLPLTMRTDPSLVQTSGSDYYGIVTHNAVAVNFTDFTVAYTSSPRHQLLYPDENVSGTQGSYARFQTNSAGGRISYDAEL